MPRSVFFSVYVPTKGLVGDPANGNPFPNEGNPEHIDIANTSFFSNEPIAQGHTDQHHPTGVVLRVIITTEDL